MVTEGRERGQRDTTPPGLSFALLPYICDLQYDALRLVVESHESRRYGGDGGEG